jgi:enoyl-CoA hydratase
VSDVLLESTDGAVRLLTLNRPQARNALSMELISALHDALTTADVDEAIRVIVLSGSDPAFCAGLDLKEVARDGEAFFAHFDSADCVVQVGEIATPVVGAINGTAFTGGLEVALGCDFLIASERALFADTHSRVGLLPTGGMTARLPALVGSGFARRMSMTGEIVDADTALRVGLVTEVVAHDELMPRALELAAAVADAHPQTLRDLKRVYVGGAEPTVGFALGVERRIADEQEHDWSTFEQRRLAVLERNRGQLS